MQTSKSETEETTAEPRPWNKAKLIGQKPPLQPKHVWAIRTRLELAKRLRDLALFNIAIDSKLPGCDVVSLNRARPPDRQCGQAQFALRREGQPWR